MQQQNQAGNKCCRRKPGPKTNTKAAKDAPAKAGLSPVRQAPLRLNLAMTLPVRLRLPQVQAAQQRGRYLPCCPRPENQPGGLAMSVDASPGLGRWDRGEFELEIQLGL